MFIIPSCCFGATRLTRAQGSPGGGLSSLFGIGKRTAVKAETGVKVTFADVAGCDEAKVEIMEFVSFLKSPQRFERLGAKIPKVRLRVPGLPYLCPWRGRWRPSAR